MSLIKRIKSAVTAILGTALLWTAPAIAAGTLPLAMAQQIDINGRPLAGCQVNFFVAGTPSSPQNAFADFGLSQSLGPQIACDQTGRVPMFWLADGLIHVRLVDATGLTQIDTTMQVLGPSSGGGGGGGGGTVDPTTVLTTGDLKARYGTGPVTGFVRANGLTIGNATSGATERANADTQALFIYLYGADPNLVVSGGRTGNALNDYNASKTIVVPDWSGAALAGLDDMGAGPRGRLTTPYFGTSPTVLGALGGAQSRTLDLTQLPTGITSSGNNLITTSASGFGTAFYFPVTQGVGTYVQGVSASGSGTNNPPVSGNNWNYTNAMSGYNNISVASNNTGGQPHSVVPPMRLATIYMKL